jgi:hypothetical protein
MMMMSPLITRDMIPKATPAGKDKTLEEELLAFRKKVCSLVAKNNAAPCSNLNK